MRYFKARFISKRHGATAGLVLSLDKFPKIGNEEIREISRMFPYSEFRKMESLEISPSYDSWDGAFNHEFTEK